MDGDETSVGARRVVQRQLDAYNARDIDAFMTHWTDDAEYFAHPSELLARGTAQIRERHIARFEEPNLFGRLINRMWVGNLVVDQELVTRTYPEGTGQVEVLAIYEVAGEKIAKAWFKIGVPVLDQTRCVDTAIAPVSLVPPANDPECAPLARPGSPPR